MGLLRNVRWYCKGTQKIFIEESLKLTSTVETLLKLIIFYDKQLNYYDFRFNVRYTKFSRDLTLDILELNGNPLGDAWLLHRNPIKHVGNAHGDLAVGNDEELRVAGELL